MFRVGSLMGFIMEGVLEKLFESVPKVRILRLFLQNSDRFFSFPEITQRSRVKLDIAKQELAKLVTIGLLTTKIGKYPSENESLSPQKRPSKKIKLYGVDPEFDFLPELKDLVTKSSRASYKKLHRQIKKLGNVKLAVLTGIFVNREQTGRTDLLVVGENITKKKIENFLAKVESELGQSLHYTLMDTDEFKYRLNMYDRFLRDILEFSHEKLINKLDI